MYKYLISIPILIHPSIMARCSSSFAVLLCLLFLSAFSFARIPVDQPEFDTATDNNHHDQYDPFSVSRPHPNPTTANTLLLPGENPDTEPGTLIHLEATDSKHQPQTVQSQPETSTESQSQVSASDPDSDSVPFTIISFRPINRHIPGRPLPLPYRHAHRCRHNHGFKPWDPMFPRRHIPYGNDMILNNGEKRSFDRMPGGEVRQIPPRWMRFQQVHVGPRFFHERDMDRSEDMRSEEIRRPHHHYHPHHLHQLQQMYQEGKHKEEGGFMMGVRKFLNQF